MSYQIERYPARKRLPVGHSTEIGRIIFHFARLEWSLKIISFNLLGINEKQGRISVRNFRVNDFVTMLDDLCKLRGIDPQVDWTKLQKDLRKHESFRDRLAHGIWMKHEATNIPVIQDISGAYTSGPNVGSKPKIAPLAVPLTTEQLRIIRQNIQFLCKQTELINEKVIGALKALRKKHVRQSRRRGR